VKTQGREQDARTQGSTVAPLTNASSACGEPVYIPLTPRLHTSCPANGILVAAIFNHPEDEKLGSSAALKDSGFELAKVCP